MNKGIDLTDLYHLRSDYTILALTGRTGSGCTTIANQLCKGFQEEDYPNPELFMQNPLHNSYRKYSIVYRHAKVNFEAFTLIRYKDALTYLILKEKHEKFIEFIKTQEFTTLDNNKAKISYPFNDEVYLFQELKDEFDLLHKQVLEIEKLRKENNPTYKELLYNLYYVNQDFMNFSEKFHRVISGSGKQMLKRNLLLQSIANNLRKTGNPYSHEQIGAKGIFTVVELMNDIIKSVRKNNELLNKKQKL